MNALISEATGRNLKIILAMDCPTIEEGYLI